MSLSCTLYVGVVMNRGVCWKWFVGLDRSVNWLVSAVGPRTNII